MSAHTHKKKIMAIYHKTKRMEMFVVEIIVEELTLVNMNC